MEILELKHSITEMKKKKSREDQPKCEKAEKRIHKVEGRL